MIERLTRKTLHHLKQRINRYERLLQQRQAIDRRLETIAKALGLANGNTASPRSHSSNAKKNRAISRALKRVWAERRKKQSEVLSPAATVSPRAQGRRAQPTGRPSPNPGRKGGLRRA